MQSDIGNHNCSRCRTPWGVSPTPRKANCAACKNSIHPAMRRIWVRKKDSLGQCYFFWKIEAQGIERPASFWVHFGAQNIHQCPTKAAFRQIVNFCFQIGHLGVGDCAPRLHRPASITLMHSPSDVYHFSEFGWLTLSLRSCSAMLFNTSARTSSTSPKSYYVFDVSKTCINLLNPMRTA